MSSTKLTAGFVSLPASTATLVVAARPGRKKVLLTFSSNSPAWIGPDNTVAPNAGYLSATGDFNGSREFETQDAIYANPGGSASGVSFLEFHD